MATICSTLPSVRSIRFANLYKSSKSPDSFASLIRCFNNALKSFFSLNASLKSKVDSPTCSVASRFCAGVISITSSGLLPAIPESGLACKVLPTRPKGVLTAFISIVNQSSTFSKASSNSSAACSINLKSLLSRAFTYFVFALTTPSEANTTFCAKAKANSSGGLSP